MNYIVKTAYGIKISNRNTITSYPLGLIQYINQLCIDELTTFEGRMHALKKIYHKRNNMPIYINKALCFFYLEPLRSLDAMVINTHKIKAIQSKNEGITMISFKDGSTLNVAFNEKHVLKRFSDALDFLKHLKADY